METFLKGIAAFALLVLVAAASAQQYQSAPAYREPETGPAVYNFNWQVKDDPTSNNYGQVSSFINILCL